MFFKSAAALALATGLAAAKPIAQPQDLPAYRRSTTPAKRSGGFGGNDFGGNNFNFIDGFNNFNNQQQVIQIQEENLQIVDNGFQQQVVQQVNEVLVVNQQQNGFNNQLNDLFRKSNFNNQFQDQSTVMLVVQEIQVSVDDGLGNSFDKSLFAQSALVANRGQFATQTVMVFSSETLIANNILGAGVNGGFGGVGNFGTNVLPTQTAGVQLFGSKPTWSSVAEDPAATLGGIWSGELQDAQNVDNNQADNDANNQAAAEEKKSLDEANKEEDQAAEGEDQAAEGEDQAAEGEDQAAEGEDQAAEGEEEQAAEGEEQAAEGEEQAEGEDQAAEGEEQAAEGEKA